MHNIARLRSGAGGLHTALLQVCDPPDPQLMHHVNLPDIHADKIDSNAERYACLRGRMVWLLLFLKLPMLLVDAHPLAAPQAGTLEPRRRHQLVQLQPCRGQPPQLQL